MLLMAEEGPLDAMAEMLGRAMRRATGPCPMNAVAAPGKGAFPPCVRPPARRMPTPARPGRAPATGAGAVPPCARPGDEI